MCLVNLAQFRLYSVSNGFLFSGKLLSSARVGKVFQIKVKACRQKQIKMKNQRTMGENLKLQYAPESPEELVTNVNSW